MRSHVHTVDPATGRHLASYEESTPAEIDRILEFAHSTAKVWATTPPSSRPAALIRLCAALRRRRHQLAELATAEMGKPIVESLRRSTSARSHATGSPDMRPACSSLLASVPQPRSEIHFQPLGVLFTVMPWNFPYWQVVRALAPAVAAGDTVVLKPAPTTTGCALALRDLAIASACTGA